MLQFDAQVLTSLDITISGAWHDHGKFQRWTGVAAASQPLVGIMLLSNGRSTEWCKTSHRAKKTGLSIELTVSRIEAETAVAFHMGGSGLRGWVADTDQTHLPDIQPLSHCRSATRVAFAKIVGTPSMGLSFLFLARQDVRSMRVGLWRVRQHLNAAILEPWITLLDRGRTGQFEEGSN